MTVKENSTQTYKISDVAEQTGLSVDTLRYYEKTGLLKKVSRAPSGVRLYNNQDLSRLRFIQRATKTLNIISQSLYGIKGRLPYY